MLLSALAWFAIVWFPAFTYEMRDRVLVIRRRVLGGIPFGTTTLRLADIHAIERTVGRIPWGAALRGRPWVHEGVVIVLEAHGHPRKVYLTPDDPAAFISQLVSLTKVAPPAPPRLLGTLLDRVPVWVADVLALVSAILAVPALAIPRTIARHPAGWIALSVAAALMLAMVFLMMFDSARAPSQNRSPWFQLWPLAIILLFPSAWLYYVIEWRRSHREGGKR